MIDVIRDELVPLARAGRLMPTSMLRPHASTYVRWAIRGLGQPRVRLETVKVGGRRFTTERAIMAFIAKLSGAETERKNAVEGRNQSLDVAEQQLDKEGIK